MNQSECTTGIKIIIIVISIIRLMTIAVGRLLDTLREKQSTKEAEAENERKKETEKESEKERRTH